MAYPFVGDEHIGRGQLNPMLFEGCHFTGVKRVETASGFFGHHAVRHRFNQSLCPLDTRLFNGLIYLVALVAVFLLVFEYRSQPVFCALVERALATGLGEIGVVVGEGVTVDAGVVVKAGLGGGYFRLNRHIRPIGLGWLIGLGRFIGLGGDAGGTYDGGVVLLEGALAVPVVAGVVVLPEGGVNGEVEPRHPVGAVVHLRVGRGGG